MRESDSMRRKIKVQYNPNICGLILALFLLFLPLLSINAQDIAKYAGEFLSIGVGARSQALGSAFVALADDATASFWNPAGLAQLNYSQISVMHAEQFAGEVNYDFISFAMPYKKKTGFALSLIRLGIDGIPDTRSALIDSIQANGRIDEGERLQLDKIKYFSNSDYALYLSIAQKRNSSLFLGGNIKIISRRFGDYSAWGIGFDLAFLAKFKNNISFGANLMDATTTLLVWNTGTKELISPLLKLGVSYTWSPDFLPFTIRPVVDADIRFEGRKEASQLSIGAMSSDFHYGLETDYKGLFYIRGGVDDIRRVSFGTGVRFPRLTVDYSFTRFDGIYELGNSHRISLNLIIKEGRFRL